MSDPRRRAWSLHIILSIVMLAGFAALIFPHATMVLLAFAFFYAPLALTYVVVSTTLFLFVRRGWYGAVASHLVGLVAGGAAAAFFVR